MDCVAENGARLGSVRIGVCCQARLGNRETGRRPRHGGGSQSWKSVREDGSSVWPEVDSASLEYGQKLSSCCECVMEASTISDQARQSFVAKALCVHSGVEDEVQPQPAAHILLASNGESCLPEGSPDNSVP